jgi:hypothetical protein
MKTPVLHMPEHGYTLNVPAFMTGEKAETVIDRILVVDLSVKNRSWRLSLTAATGHTNN